MANVHFQMKAVSIASGLTLALVAGVWGDTASGDDPPSTAAGTRVDYESQVKPILTQHCVSCHGVLKPRGGLRLDTAAAAVSGGKNGPAVVAGKAAESSLIAAVRGEGPTEQMPLNRPAAYRSPRSNCWRPGSTRGPRRKPASSRVCRRPGRTGRSFLRSGRQLRQASHAGMGANPIDRFIQARLDKARLSPSPEADRPAAPPAQPRPDRPAAVTRGDRRVPCRPIGRRL